MKYLLHIFLILSVLLMGCLQGVIKTDDGANDKKKVPVNYPEESKSLKNPLEPSDENLQIGEKKYGIFCSMCHGMKGRGGEEVTKSFEVEPSSLVNEEVKKRTDGELFWAISNGVNGTKMLPWGELLSDEEIWAIVNHIRVLQKKA